MNFGEFFKAATGNEPYDYQCRLACGKRAERETRAVWLSHGTACESRLINIPTGLGKTAAVVLAWLWNRVHLQNSKWPRRLVYCLPMRTLVEQTRDEVVVWLGRLALAAAPENSDAWLRVRNAFVELPAPIQAAIADFRAAGSFAGELAPGQEELVWLFEHSPVVLMGGEEVAPKKGDWDIHPEQPAILIGTQDMLLSRALNRGYGMSRYRWPMHFGLLNNDCLWVLDEVQLMASGFSTSLQLQAWRDDLALRCRECARLPGKLPPVMLPTHSWWMSATAAQHWLGKSNAMRPRIDDLWTNRLRADPATDARDLFAIPKTLHRCPCLSLRAAENEASGQPWQQYACAVANHLATAENRKGKKRASDTEETEDVLTLVVCDTVDRAAAIHDALKRLNQPGTNESPFDENHLLLLHSRFRGNERRAWPEKLKAFEKGEGEHAGPRIIVTTQVIEAGVDISASVLYTELCPLASLIQRLGRCARRAGQAGKAFWIDFDEFSNLSDLGEFSEEQKQLARPYGVAEIAAARAALIRAGNATISKAQIGATTHEEQVR